MSQTTKKGTGTKQDTKSATQKPKNLEKEGEKVKEDLDALIEEIDGVLEENAEEFVKNYVQRGGE